MMNADAMLVEVRHPDTGAAVVSAAGASREEIDMAIRRAAKARATPAIAGDDVPTSLVVYPLGLDGHLGRRHRGIAAPELPDGPGPAGPAGRRQRGDLRCDPRRSSYGCVAPRRRWSVVADVGKAGGGKGTIPGSGRGSPLSG